MQQDEELTIPGLEPSSVSTSAVAITATNENLSLSEIETDTVVVPTKMVNSSSSRGLSEAALKYRPF
jgi:hypothetical protein